MPGIPGDVQHAPALALSSFDHTDSLAAQQIWQGVVGRSVHGERMTLVVIELEPGAEVPEHSHDNEQLGVLIQGAMSFTIGGEAGECVPGSFWRILSNVPHSVVAGPEGAVAVETFAPPRSEWAVLPPADPGPGRWP